MSSKCQNEDILIRAVRSEDLKDINEMRRMKGIREHITGIASERMDYTEQWFKNLSSNNHVLVAEDLNTGHVIGSVGLTVKTAARLSHVGGIGIMVHTQFQNRGIGKALMEHILDLADNWLNIVRVELNVSTDNIHAIALYKSLDFSIEGVNKYAGFAFGKYIDFYQMARYRNFHKVI